MRPTARQGRSDRDTATGRLLGNPRPNGQNPTAPASFRLRVSVTDVAERDSASKEVELPVAPAAVPFDHTTDPLRIQTPPGVLSRGYVGHEYGFTPGILGGIEPYTSSVDLDPASGLQWDASLHKLTGIPEKPGRVRFTLTVTDQQDTYGVLKAQGNEVAARADYEIAIERLEIHVEASLPVGRVAEAYRGAAAMRGGLPPYTVEASLPEGLEIDPAQGIVTGKPEKEGLFPVEIRVKDSVGTTASLTETLRVLKPIPKLRIVTVALAPGTAGSKYDQRIAHEGGTAPLTWRITTDASFPASLSTLENGIQGVPERESSGAKIKVEATDALGETASREYTLDVFPKKRPLRQAYDPGK